MRAYVVSEADAAPRDRIWRRIVACVDDEEFVCPWTSVASAVPQPDLSDPGAVDFDPEDPEVREEDSQFLYVLCWMAPRHLT